MKASRVFQLTALALVLVAAVQVGWWIFDQHAYTVEKVRGRAQRLRRADRGRAGAAGLRDAGAAGERAAARSRGE